MGDYAECINYTDKRFDPTTIDPYYLAELSNAVPRQIETIKELFDPIMDKCIGLLRGNHEETIRLRYHYDVMYEFWKRWKVPILGDIAWVVLRFVHDCETKGKKPTSVFKMIATHGNVGGRTAGYKLNRMEHMTRYYDADIYLMGHCLSNDSEILTQEGWKKYNEIKNDDIIYTFNKDKEIIELQKIDEIIIQKYNGEMYNIKNSNVDMLVTPNHRVLHRFVSQRPNKIYNHKWLFKKARDFSKMTSQIQIPLASYLSDEYFLVPYFDIWNEKIFELMGWIIAEGTFCKKHAGIRIAQDKKGRYAELKKCLDNIDIKYSTHRRGFYIPAKYGIEIRKYLYEKHIPFWAFYLNDVQFAYLLRGLVLGDGTPTKNGGTFSQKDEKLIDTLQALLTLHGYRSIKKYKKGGFKNGAWQLIFNNRNTTDMALSRELITKQSYNDEVWCVRIKNETFIARRNGKPFITGNSHIKAMSMDDQLYLDNRFNQKRRKRIKAVTGCFLEGYKEEHGSYVEKWMYPPTNLGVVKIQIQPKRRDIHISE